MFDGLTLNDLFGWFFKAVRGFYEILDKTMVIDIAGFSFSFFDLFCVFILLSLVISAFIKSGGARVDV